MFRSVTLGDLEPQLHPSCPGPSRPAHRLSTRVLMGPNVTQCRVAFHCDTRHLIHDAVHYET
jgi:hypothetical protein